MKTRKLIYIVSFLIFLVIAGFFAYFFLGAAPRAENIVWGVNFSQKHAELLNLDWRETYSAILDDLKVKNIKLLVSWDWIESRKDEPFFDDLDWQIEEAGDHQAEIILVIGMKTGRWPECHIPDWAKNSSREDLQNGVLDYLEEVVSRYEESDVIRAWQVENEPFFSFGVCPKTDKNFLEKEIALVKSLDGKKRPVIVSDSGESSLWLKAASVADILGITMYRKTNNKFFGVVNYPFPPVFYWRKAQIIKWIFNKPVICGELQAEPWGTALLYDSTLEEQKQTMDLEQFMKNMEFAKKTGFSEFYLWGAEWWFWLKVKYNDNSLWEEAGKLFNS
ncbi:MAG: hypothetical protein PHQ47_03495 [Candidatus Portnoybacteria bacterium]|nr:hypothetical protein [Candidatus Portnoybacteria bacterium]